MDISERLRGARRHALSSAIAAVLLCSGQAAVYAQQTTDTAASDTDEIVVTGTRIRRTDFDSPNAVSTLTAEDIDALGLLSVSDMLMEMTANVASESLETSGDSSFFVGATIANLRGMNPAWGASRTLTLVDGRRMPGTTNGGAVDLGMIPSVLVGRMETVTGGAGATYGSDAMAGVVNIVLNREIEGTRVRMDYGQFDAGDGKQYTFSIANGTRLLNGRGHFTIGFEHDDRKPVLDCHTARDWCAASRDFVDMGAAGGQGTPDPNDPRQWDVLPPLGNPALPGMGLPRYAVFENVRFLHSNPNGSLHTNNQVETDPFNGVFLQFTPDGSDILPYQESLDPMWREYAYGGAGRRVVGGEGKLRTHGYTLRQGSERNNLYSRFIYAFNDHTSLTSEVSFGRNEARNSQTRPGFFFRNDCILLNNEGVGATGNAFTQEEFMTAQARQALLDRGSDTQCSGSHYQYLASFAFAGATFGEQARGVTLRKDWSDQLEGFSESETDTLRGVVSLSGGLFGGRNWTYDASLTWGRTDRYQAQINNRTNRRYQMALDSVIDSGTGNAVCRINESGALGDANRAAWLAYFTEQYAGDAQEVVDSLREGCAPLNPFGMTASQAAIDYAWSDLIEFTKRTNTIGSVSFSGVIWDGVGAGPFQMAGGIDYRRDETDNWTGGDENVHRRIDFNTQYGDPWKGGNETTDIFTEFDMPLLRGRPGVEYMMLNLSHRRSRTESFREDEEERLEAVRYTDSQKVSFVYRPINWLTLRTTRSMDIRQPSTRELFYRQSIAGGGFFSFQTNPWRDPDIAPDQNDQYGMIIGSNPNLRNERSITETLGLVFAPQGWGRGLQFSLDYYKIQIKDGITYGNVSDPEQGEYDFTFGAPPFEVFRCFHFEDPYYCSLIEFGEPHPDEPDNPRSNIESYTTSMVNSEPFWSRGFDISAAYTKRLARGSFSVRLMGTRSIEQNICVSSERVSVDEVNCSLRDNVVGQTGGLRAGGLGANYTPTPTWSGNLFGTYRRNALSVTAQARFTGRAQGSVFWVGPDDPRWEPDAHFTISQNRMPSWTTWNTTISYNLGQSGFAPERFTDLNVSLRIDNVFDKQPNFWSGGGIGGVNTRFFSGMGRNYRLGLTMQF